MFNVSFDRLMRITRLGALAVAALLVCTPAVFAQATGTATVRGTVTDSSGGVLPGATVTVLNSGTKSVVTAVTDDRGGYLAVLFPGTYELKVELSGFKTYEQKGIVISPDLTRGIDVKLEVGQQSETITVTAQQEVIQTETGAREGVLSAKQIDNLSVIGRSALELLRIMPGVVAPDPIQLESVSFGGGANNTQGYTVNGIRSSTNTVSLDGSNLIDVGSNSGVIVTLNNDMVQEVKVQSSNFAAEYGSGGMNVSAVTKAGTSQFHGTLYDYSRNYRFAANDRSNSIAGVEKPHSTFQYPGGNIGGPIILPGTDFNKNHDKLFFFAGIEVQRQQVDSGSRFGTVPTLAERNGDFSEFLTGNGQNLGQGIGCFNGNGSLKSQSTSPASCVSGGGIAGLIIPKGFPGAGGMVPGANLNNVPGMITPLGKLMVNLYPTPNYTTSNNQYNYVYSTLEPTNRLEMKYRFDWNITNNTKAYVRIAHDNEDATSPRGVWWGASDVALPSPNVGTNHGRSYSGNVVSVLSPTTTNEALVSWSRLTLDNTYQDPSVMSLSTYGINPAAVLRHTEPVHPRDRSELGRWCQQHVERGERHVRAQRRAALLGQGDEDHGGPRPQVRRQPRPSAEAAELQQQRRGSLVYAAGSGPRAEPRRATQWATSTAGQIDAVQVGHARAARRVPLLELRRLRAGLVEAQAEPHAGIRHPDGLLDEQPGAQRPRWLLRSDASTIRATASSWIRARSVS